MGFRQRRGYDGVMRMETHKEDNIVTAEEATVPGSPGPGHPTVRTRRRSGNFDFIPASATHFTLVQQNELFPAAMATVLYQSVLLENAPIPRKLTTVCFCPTTDWGLRKYGPDPLG